METITLSSRKKTPKTYVQNLSEIKDKLNELKLQPGQPTILLVGGADALDESLAQSLKSLFVENLAPFAEELGAYVVDGGTDAGVMRLMGEARKEIDGTFPLIGVASIDTVNFLGNQPKNQNAADLESNHTHFVFVPGENWGDESPWLHRIASFLSEGSTSVTILINGGEIARKDVENSLVSERSVIVISGTGRLADEIAKMKKNPPLIKVVDLSEISEKLRTTLAKSLKSGEVDKYDEYKFFAKSTQFLTERRQSAHRVYLSVNTAIFAVMAFLIKDAKIEVTKLVLANLPLVIVGILVCCAWLKFINQYKELINWRYGQLMGMEKTLKNSHRMYIKEWQDFFKPFSGKEKFGFSRLEAWLPKLFIALYLSYEIFLIRWIVFR